MTTVLKRRRTGQPTSSTDNTVPRFDGAFGKLQTSGVTIDDNNVLKAAKLSGTVMSIADDAVGTFTIPGTVTRCLLDIVGGIPSYSGMFFVRTDVAQSAILAAGATMAVSTGVLAGTTGVDGKITISPHTDGNVYVENRSGATYTMHYSLRGSP